MDNAKAVAGEASSRRQPAHPPRLFINTNRSRERRSGNAERAHPQRKNAQRKRLRENASKNK
jgi:hypothetical protein